MPSAMSLANMDHIPSRCTSLQMARKSNGPDGRHSESLNLKRQVIFYFMEAL
jgi:hypothetical protein